VGGRKAEGSEAADPDQGWADPQNRSRGPALRLYLDTSALLKLYIDEEGSDLIRARRAEADMVGTSLITLVETRAALARRRRAGHASLAHQRRVLAELSGDWDRYVKLEVSDSLVRRAAELAEIHYLRGYDAVHLASALLLSDRLGDETAFGSWDDALDIAASREGLSLVREHRRRS
jgi:uncharacterized protein